MYATSLISLAYSWFRGTISNSADGTLSDLNNECDNSLDNVIWLVTRRENFNHFIPFQFAHWNSFFFGISREMSYVLDVNMAQDTVDICDTLMWIDTVDHWMRNYLKYSEELATMQINCWSIFGMEWANERVEDKQTDWAIELWRKVGERGEWPDGVQMDQYSSSGARSFSLPSRSKSRTIPRHIGTISLWDYRQRVRGKKIRCP